MNGLYYRILRYIDTHIDEDITLEALSAEVGYSRRHLYRIFNKYSGVPIMQYIRRKKLSAAVDRMLYADNMFDIALDYGYESSAGFYKAFVGIYGCSPSDYRKNKRRMINMDNNTYKSIEELTELIDKTPDDAELYMERAKAFFRAGQRDDALNDCDRAFKNGAGAVAYRFTATVYEHCDDYEKAVEALDKAIKLEPRFAENYRRRGCVYGYMGRDGDAVEDFTKAIRLNPENIHLYVYKSAVYFRMGERERSEACLDEMTAVCHDKTQAYLSRGEFYMQRQLYDRAYEYYSMAVKLSPDNYRVYFALAFADFKRSEYVKSAENYTRAIELAPELAHLYRNRANCYLKLGEDAKAEADLNKTLELEVPVGNSGYYLNRGVVYYQLKQYDKALESYTRAIEIEPNMHVAYSNRANVYAELERYDEAIADFKTALKIDPTFIYCYNRVIQLYMQTGNYDKAYETNERFAATYESKPGFGTHKGDYNVYYVKTVTNRAEICKMTGDAEKSAELYAKAAEIDPDNTWHYYNLVNVCAYYDMPKDKADIYLHTALDYYSKALVSYNTQTGSMMNVRSEREWKTRIYRYRAVCYETMGLFEDAENDYGKSRELETDATYIYHFRISRYLRLKRYDIAARMASRAMELLDDAKLSVITHVYEQIIAGECEKAVAALEAVDASDRYANEAGELLEAMTD